MKKFVILSLVLLSGCSATSNNDPILGRWSEEGKNCTGKTFCSFTISKDSKLTSNYKIVFDVVPKEFPNNGIIQPNWKGSEGVYYYTNPVVMKGHPTAKGVMMYLDKGMLVETNRGTRFKKDL